MNLIENYIEPGYTIKVLKNKTVNGDTFVMFDGFVNCYGNVTHRHLTWALDEWKEIEKKGYFVG